MTFNIVGFLSRVCEIVGSCVRSVLPVVCCSCKWAFRGHFLSCKPGFIILLKEE